MTSVILVDDQNIVLEGLVSLMSISPEIDVMAWFHSGEECIDFLADNRPPDVILLDMHMPGMKGLDVLAELRRIADIPVVFLTTFNDSYLRQQCAESGAQGLLHKNISLDELIGAVLKVASGGHLWPRDLRAETEHMTPQEGVIARALVEGKTNKEIAATSELSPGTVRNYLSNLFSKLGVRNRAEAVIRLKELGLF